MVYNRYVGNTGRFIRVDDEPVIIDRPNNPKRTDNLKHAEEAPRANNPKLDETPHRPDNIENPTPHRRTEHKEPRTPPHSGGVLSALLGGKGGLLGGKGGLLSGKGILGGQGLRFLDNILPFGMDTGDLALIVLFFFLYIESGDDEFLIIMAFLAYSIFKDRPKALL